MKKTLGILLIGIFTYSNPCEAQTTNPIKDTILHKLPKYGCLEGRYKEKPAPREGWKIIPAYDVKCIKEGIEVTKCVAYYFYLKTITYKEDE